MRSRLSQWRAADPFTVASTARICNVGALMRLLRSSFFALAAALALSGCPDKSKPAEEPTAPVEATPPEPEPLEFSVTGELVDGTSRPIPSETPELPVLPALAGISISSNLSLTNHRIRVFDEADRVVESDDETEAPPPGGGIVYRIRFSEPLKSGHRYALVIDAETGDFMTDGAGREQAERRLPFQIEGEKEKPQPVPQRRRGR